MYFMTMIVLYAISQARISTYLPKMIDLRLLCIELLNVLRGFEYLVSLDLEYSLKNE